MSVLNPVVPACPTGCGTTTPKVTFSRCAPETNAAGIQRLFYTNVGYPLADSTDAAEWLDRISNTDLSASAIRYLHVIGSKPRPEGQKTKLSLGREKIGKKKHSVLIKIDETNDDNYEFLRANECGGQRLAWYESGGNKLYGGSAGIPVSLTLDDVLVEDTAQMETFDGEMTWESSFHPERHDSPIAAY